MERWESHTMEYYLTIGSTDTWDNIDDLKKSCYIKEASIKYDILYEFIFMKCPDWTSP
jgi:hypothetical protein